MIIIIFERGQFAGGVMFRVLGTLLARKIASMREVIFSCPVPQFDEALWVA